MSAAYQTSHLLFEESPQIKQASSGVRRQIGAYSIVAHARVPGTRHSKAYYLHSDGLWRNSQWTHADYNAYFKSQADAGAVLGSVANQIKISKK